MMSVRSIRTTALPVFYHRPVRSKSCRPIQIDIGNAEIFEGPPGVTVNRVAIEGNEGPATNVVMRETRILPGQEVLNRSALGKNHSGTFPKSAISTLKIFEPDMAGPNFESMPLWISPSSLKKDPQLTQWIELPEEWGGLFGFVGPWD